MDYGEERLVSVGWLREEVAVCVWVEWGDVARIMRRGVHPPDEPLARASSLRKADKDEEEDWFRTFAR